MKKNSITENITELNAVIKSYVDARIDLLKVNLIDKTAKIGTYLFSAVFFLVAILFVMLLLSFAFSFWYGNTFGKFAEGFLIAAVFFVLIALVVFIFRKPLFTNNIVKNVASIVFSDNQSE